MIYGTAERLKEEGELYNLLIQRYEAELSEAPPGSLSIKRINQKDYLYQCLTRWSKGERVQVQKCLSKCDTALIAKLKRKRFLKESLSIFYRNKKAIETFLTQYEAYDPETIERRFPKAYLPLPVECYSDTKFQKYEGWNQENLIENTMKRECVIHTTINGNKVRSKSEAIIAGMLELYQIPYRYEAPLELGGYTYFPDFEILCVSDRKIVYWEHFGLIGNVDYRMRMDHKLAV